VGPALLVVASRLGCGKCSSLTHRRSDAANEAPGSAPHAQVVSETQRSPDTRRWTGLAARCQSASVFWQALVEAEKGRLRRIGDEGVSRVLGWELLWGFDEDGVQAAAPVASCCCAVGRDPARDEAPGSRRLSLLPQAPLRRGWA
jgi:hypothetical protein